MDDHMALIQSRGGHRKGSEIRIDDPGGAQFEELGRGGVVSQFRNESESGCGQQGGGGSDGGEGLFHDFQGWLALSIAQTMP